MKTTRLFEILLFLLISLSSCQAHENPPTIQDEPTVTIWIYPVTSPASMKMYICGGRMAQGTGIKQAGNLNSQAAQIMNQISLALKSVGLSRNDIRQVTYLTKTEQGEVAGIPSVNVMNQLKHLDTTLFDKQPVLIDYKSVGSLGAEEVLLEIEVIAGN